MRIKNFEVGMNFYVLSLFPEMVESVFKTSITGRGQKAGRLSLTSVNIRDFSHDKHQKVDDYPYGGGAGLVMKPDCVYEAYMNTCKLITDRKTEAGSKGECVSKRGSGGLQDKPYRLVYMTPQGRVFNSEYAKDLAQEEDLMILCGHYEGIDERVLKKVVTDYISIGDYVLTGGELAANVVMDAVSRFVPGVLGNCQSADTDTFSDGLLEYPQYTRPYEFEGEKVPDILLSGHHENVDKWRFRQKLIRTAAYRPDLFEKYIKNNPEAKKYIGDLDISKGN